MQNKQNVLIVEDEYINAILLEEFFKDTDFDLFVCQDGVSAVEYYKNHTEIPLVLMDLRLPKMSGIEASKLIKEINPNVFIIAQSAYDNKETKLEVAIAGIDVFLSKPIDLDELTAIIKAVFEK